MADALATLEAAGKLAPKDSTVLCMTGVVDLKLGKQDEAEGFFKKAVAVNPRDSWATELLRGEGQRSDPAASAAAGCAAEAGIPGQSHELGFQRAGKTRSGRRPINSRH